MEFVGKIVKKEFKGLGVFSGTVKSYNESSGCFEIVYEAGNSEELEFSELAALLEEKPADGVLKGKAGIQNDFDLNAKYNLNLNEEFVLFEENNLNGDCQGSPKRQKCIDLNLDVNGDIFEHLEGFDMGCEVEDTQKRKCEFDLNLVVDEEIKEDTDVVCSCSCQGSAEGLQKEDTVSGEGIRACDCVEVLDARGVKEDNLSVIDWNRGEISTPNEEGSERRVEDMLETVVSMNANDVRGDQTMVVNGNRAGVGSMYTEVCRSRRKRRNLLDNANSVPETAILRRSTRRGFAATMMSGVADDSPMSSAVSPLTVEKSVRARRRRLEESIVLPPKVQLPPSSEKLDLGDISIPMIDLFSVYALLRSFSTLLFLSPFEVDEFVDALKSRSPSTLIDSIHVSILQMLRKHLEHLSNEGSESASNCLRSLNWGLLDLITWPIFMVEYLLINGTSLTVALGFDPSSLKLFTSGYYKQPASVKVEILRCLCDDMMEVEAVRSELNRRSSRAEIDMNFNRNMNPRACKKMRGMMNASGGSCSAEEDADNTTDWNSDECCLCKMDGTLICCDGCPAAYHSKCVGVVYNSLPKGLWYCRDCVIDRHKPWMRPPKSLRGADLLGVDPYGRLYYNSCGYLLVSYSCNSEFSFNYYHRDDLNAVIQLLKSSELTYGSILEAIHKHWDIPVGLYRTSSNVDSISFSVCLDMCMPPVALASSETCTAKIEISDEGKADEKPVSGCSNHLGIDASKSVSPTCMSSEGSATQMSSGNQNVQKEGPDHCHRSVDVSNESETPRELPSLGDSSLTSTGLDSKQNNPESAVNGNNSSPANTADGKTLKMQPRIHYVNYYIIGHIASLVEEELRKSSDTTIEGLIKSVEEIISEQMKIISKKFTKFRWENIPNIIADVQRQKCGWCYSCRNPSDDLDCLFNMILGTVKKGSASGVVGFQSNRNTQGHLMDVICQILMIEDRLRGLLLGPWINPHYTKGWRKSVIEAPDVASAKRLLLILESNLHRLALSAEWLKNVDSTVTMGSASHVVIASSKNGISRKRARNSESESNPSSNSASGLRMFWWRGGRLSRQLFSWKVLPCSLVCKAARQAGCRKIPGILYHENSDFVKRSKYVAWRAAVESSTSVAQLALQVRELDLNIRWDEIENTHLLPLLDKELRKSIRLFKKAIIRKKCMEGDGAKYLIDFGKRKIIPEVVSKYGSLVEESSSERKKYWVNESYVPLYLLKSFEEKRIARKSNKMSPGKLSDAGGIIKKLPKEKWFSYLLARAERLEYHQCGHCKKDVLIREAVSCQYCKGFFHKRHVRKSAGSIIADCVYTCCQCTDEKYVKNEPKTGNSSTKRGENTKNANIQPQKSENASTGKRGQLKKGKKSRVSQPLRSQNGKKVVPLRRSARKAKINSLLSKNVGGCKKGKAKSGKRANKKLKKGTLPKNGLPKMVSVKRDKRTKSSYWLNGLQLSRKPDDERVVHFRRKRFLAPFESVIPNQPKCHICFEPGYTANTNYISCEMCGEWFHGDAFGLDAEKIPLLIGFRCHKCLKRIAPTCPFIPATINDEALLGEVQKNAGTVQGIAF